MIIAIDTQELKRLEKANDNIIGGEQIHFAIHLLLYYSARLQEYFRKNQKELAKYGCLRNPVIIEEDDFKIEAKFWFAYFFYYLAMRKMSRIYNKLPQEGIRNDLLLIYEHLSELAKVLKITKQKTKWDNCIKQIKGEIEINE